MQHYDIVFVGAGLSSSATLYHVLENLQNQYSGPPKNIAVIEKNNEFWKGMPYGNRSSIHSLTINPIKDFFVDAEKPVFFAWLNSYRKSNWGNTTSEEKDILNNWTVKNAAQLNDQDFDGVYIPRFLYGIYLAEKLDNAIAACQLAGIAHIERIAGEAVDVNKTLQGHYHIAVDTAGPSLIISAETLILGTGSLDTRRISGNQQFGHLLIDDIYHPNLELNLKRLDDALAQLPYAQRNMLIIGANASASEILHMLSKSIKTQKNNFNKISILSTSGLPDRLYVNNDYDYLLNHLKALEAAGNYKADDLMEAIRLDVENAAANHQLSVGKIHYSLSDRAVKIQQKLSPEESLKFFNNHGWSFTRITRRTSEDYYITEKELADAGKLEFIKGRFVKLQSDQTNPVGLTFIYKDSDAAAEEKVYPTPFPIVINCIGAEHPSNTTSKLYANLLAKGILQINHNNMGLAADENFLANDNLYLIGPLLAGIYNSKFKFWHLENAKRLNGLAAVLANTITERMA